MIRKSNSENQKEFAKENIKSTNAKDQNISKMKKEISRLSYEDALNELDSIIAKLKTQDLLIEDLQNTFQKGLIYIDHCEELLNKVEQEIIEMNID